MPLNYGYGGRSAVTSDERSSFGIGEEATGGSSVEGVAGFEDGTDGDDKGTEGEPVDEGDMLSGKDTQESPSDDQGPSDVTFGPIESVTDAGGSQKDQGDSDEDFGPNTGMVRGILTKGGKEGDDDEDDGPSVPEGPRQVNEKGLGRATGGVRSEGPVNMRHGRGQEDDNDEGPDVMVGGVQMSKDGV